MQIKKTETIDYKQKIMNMLVNSNDLYNAIDNKTLTSPEQMIYDNIFPYGRVPDTVDEALSFIGFMVEVPTVQDYKNTYNDVIITFYIITNQQLMKTDLGCTRIDYIAQVIRNLFVGSLEFGVHELSLMSDLENKLAIGAKHRSRVLKFTSLDMNKWG